MNVIIGNDNIKDALYDFDINYKYSHYNVEIEIDNNSWLIFNTSSMSLVEIDSNMFSFLRDKSILKFTNISGSIRNNVRLLILNGFLVAYEKNEAEDVKNYIYNKWGKFSEQKDSDNAEEGI